MLDVRRLRLLRELAHRGTIAAVAEALSFSPSAVSQQLSVLEREAGVALLERAGRRVVLTPAGRGLAEHAEAVLERLELAASDLAATRRGLAGPIRIGAFPTVARALLPAALAALAREHPALEPQVDEVDPAGVPDALRGGGLDVALVHDYDGLPELPRPGLDRYALLDEPVFLAERADGPARPDGTLADRAGAPWILARPGTLCHAMAVQACAMAGFEPRVRHRVDEFATVLELVAAGQGVALVPALGAIGRPPAVALTPLPMRRRTAALHRSGAGRHPAVAAVLGALHAAARELDLPGPSDG